MRTYKVKEMAIEFSSDGNTWIPYSVDGVPKVGIKVMYDEACDV